MADLQCNPWGISRPLLKYLFDTTRECELIHGIKPKRTRTIFYARMNTQIGANGRCRNSALLPHALAHLPQIEHSGTAEKSGK
jgi:hypothetical protein